MSNQIQFQLVSPQKRYCDKPVAMVTVPGEQGCFGVMAGHAPLAAAIGNGVLETYDEDTTSLAKRWFVAGGFCEVVAHRCTVLADQVIEIDALNREEIEAEIRTLAKTKGDGVTVLKKIALAEAKLQALQA
ncbi:MAG: ATP synthase F1 subunit epsilon [Proteobacteria bacterium]|jgi:F-type H+-transporting ATPase subunit epsilon|nr:ATP synthase F1 subunit epsilon [Alphaproteobacteria bacterium]NCC03184.1 ATP synthase F1 subunit epsilon [Pseudomonadota bacterium]